MSVRALPASAPDGIGKLTLLIGGDGAAIERARPALETFAARMLHVGGSGAGRAMKLVNNMLFAAHAQIGVDAGVAPGPLEAATAACHD